MGMAIATKTTTLLVCRRMYTVRLCMHSIAALFLAHPSLPYFRPNVCMCALFPVSSAIHPSRACRCLCER
jgi:hypothetical protein